jgi:3-oxoacyl-[acyl-carrier-protein] synthase II
MKRVVVTGVGSINPLGNSVLLSWNRLVESKSGIVHIEKFPTDDLSSKIAGFCSPIAINDDRLSPAVHYALHAVDEAVKDSGIQGSDGERIVYLSMIIFREYVLDLGLGI